MDDHRNQQHFIKSIMNKLREGFWPFDDGPLSVVGSGEAYERTNIHFTLCVHALHGTSTAIPDLT